MGRSARVLGSCARSLCGSRGSSGDQDQTLGEVACCCAEAVCLVVRVVVVAALQVTEQDIANIVAQWTGIPIEKVSADETERLIKMEEVLHGRVIGQVCMGVWRARMCVGAQCCWDLLGWRVPRPKKGGKTPFAAMSLHNILRDAVAVLTAAACCAVPWCAACRRRPCPPSAAPFVVRVWA